MTEEFDMSNLKEFDKILNKKFGSQYTGFGEKDSFEKVSRVPLDCISLNNILGGGIPEGRVIEIFGRNSAGKSSLANHIVASFQKQGKYCMWVDAEACFDAEYTANCNVNLDSLCKVNPNSAEEALEAIRTGLNLEDSDGKPVLSLIVLDSVAALTPRVDFDEKKEIGTTQIGSLARLLSTSLKQIVTLAAKTKATIILLNQERAANLTGYGPKTTTTGGSAIGYYSSIRLDLNRVGWLEEDKEKVGQIVNVETVKNKTFTPYKSADVHLIFPVKRGNKIVAGVDTLSDVVNIAIDNDIIKKTGSWFTWGEDKFQGLNKVYSMFIEDKDKYDILYKQVKELYNASEKDDGEA